MKKRISVGISVMMCLAVLAVGCKQEEEVTVIKSHKDNATVITLFLPFDGNNDASRIYNDIVEEYNDESSGVEIHTEGIATADGFNTILEQRIEQGEDGVDLFIVNADSVKRLQEKDAFCDLSELSAYEMLTEAAKEQAVIDDTVYTIPLQMTAYGLYVNTGLLKEHGLDVPKNLGEFLECCRILKEDGVTPISLNRWYAMTTFTIARGMYPIYQSENKGKIIKGLNDGSIKIGDYMLEGFRLFETLVKNGYYGDGITREQTDQIKAITSDIDDFANEKTAFFAAPMGKEYVIDEKNEEIEFIEEAFPVMTDGMVSMPAPAARLCVNAKGKHVEEAMEAAEYLTFTKAEEFSKEGAGLIPAIEGVTPEKIDKRADTLYKKAIQPGQVPIEDMTLHFSCWDVVRELCLDIIDGMTPEEAAEAYNEIQMEAVGRQ